MIGLDIADLRVEREGRTVLEIDSLVLRANQTTAILGPNGAGKSTLLRAIAGLDRPQRGRIVLGGQAARPVADARLDIAFVFQEPVFLRRSLRANFELALGLRGVSRREGQERINEAVELLGITSLLNRLPSRLSEGERRRASLARALCLQAPLLLLDEPLAGLDRFNYERLLEELPALLRHRHTTTIFVTHDRHEALSLAEDVVVLIDGRVRAAGQKRTVVSRPREASVAAVLGCWVLAAQDRLVAVPRDGLMVGPGPNEFSMVVEQVRDLIDVQEILGRIDDVRVRVRVPGSAGPQPGDRLRVHADSVSELDGDP